MLQYTWSIKVEKQKEMGDCLISLEEEIPGIRVIPAFFLMIDRKQQCFINRIANL